MEPCYQSIEGKPRKSRCRRGTGSPPLKKRCLPLSLSHTIRLPLLLHTKHTVVHLYTYTHLEKKKFVRIIPPLSYYSPCPVNRARQSHRLCTARIPRFRSTTPPPPPNDSRSTHALVPRPFCIGPLIVREWFCTLWRSCVATCLRLIGAVVPRHLSGRAVRN